MGATVLTGKRAGAFQRGNGEWIFALFERTYDKNCYPHRDHWSGITIGNYASVMRRVFRHARSCEGGMLQSRSGGIRPEHYIEAWRQELARPMVLNDREIDLRVGETFGAPIPEKALDDVRLCLANAGQHSRFDALVAGGLSVPFRCLRTSICSSRCTARRDRLACGGCFRWTIVVRCRSAHRCLVCCLPRKSWTRCLISVAMRSTVTVVWCHLTGNRGITPVGTTALSDLS